MRTKDLINKNIPRLKLQDTVHKALQLIDDFRIPQLPVVSEDNFLGLITEEDLLDIYDDKTSLEFLQKNFILSSVPEDAHFLAAVNTCIQNELQLTAVLNDKQKYAGAVTSADLFKELGAFTGATTPGGIIVLEMEWNQYNPGEINRLIESNDCILLNINTRLDPGTGKMAVTLQINKQELATVVATFERYDYHVLYYLGSEKFENEVEGNYKNLMYYLDI